MVNQPDDVVRTERRPPITFIQWWEYAGLPIHVKGDCELAWNRAIETAWEVAKRTRENFETGGYRNMAIGAEEASANIKFYKHES